MSKEPVPEGYMDGLLRGRDENTERTQSEHRANTERTQKDRDKKDFGGFKPTELKTFSIRLKADDIRRLKRYFDSRDTTLSQGLRIVIKDFIERQGL